MKKKFLSCLTLLLTASLLAGCQSNVSNSLAEQDTESGDAIPADWNEGFLVGPQQEGDSLYVAEFLSLEHREPEEMTRHYPPVCRVSGECFYALQKYDTRQGQKVFLEIHSLGKSAPDQTLELDMSGWQLPDASIQSFDLAEDGYVFLVKTESVSDTDGVELPGVCQIVHTDLQGVLVSQTDLTDMLKDQELFRTAWANQADLYRDREGFLYLVMDQYSVLLVLDQDGNIVTQYNGGTSGYGKVEEPVRDNSGRLIFPMYLGEERITRFLGRVGKDLKELAVFQEPINGEWLGMYDSCMYYVEKKGVSSTLIRWNVGSGLRESVLDMALLGITDGHNLCMVLKGERDIYLRAYSRNAADSEDFLVTLSEQEPERANPVSLVMLAQENDGKFLGSTLARFSRNYPQYDIFMDPEGDDRETYRTRIMADIMSGGGPDILCVSLEDMEILADAGALIPIDELVSEETLENLLPNVLQFCTYEGKLTGIIPFIKVQTLNTSISIWADDSWSLDDVLKLAEEKEGLEGILTYGLIDASEYNVLHSLVGINIEETRFIDMQNRKSCFEQENFMRVLEVVKRYAPKGNSSGINGHRRIADETHLAIIEYIDSPFVLFSIIYGAGFEGNIVGYPTESGGGNYMTPGGFLVVNARTENLEAVSAFLEYLLSFESQSRLGEDGISVRSNMADRLIEFDEEYGYVWTAPSYGTMILKTFENPTEEYDAFLKRCEPYRYNHEIFDIVWEESQAYFSGDKDALTVTRAIDNRVQVYLDERN